MSVDASEPEVADEVSVGDGNQIADDQSEEVGNPEYQELGPDGGAGQTADMARVQNIQVSVSAELGRASVPIQKLMELAEGSVVELDREIDSPVDLVAQGVRLAAGEVVVVDGRFAVRITEVFESK